MKKETTWDFICEVFWRTVPFLVGYAIGGFIAVKAILYLKSANV